MAQFDQLKCQQEGHENKIIDGICMQQSCRANTRMLCMRCLQTIHRDCSNTFYDQEEFIKKIKRLKDQIVQEPIEVVQLKSITQKIVNSIKDVQSFVQQIITKYQKPDRDSRIDRILANQQLLSANDWKNGYELLAAEQSSMSAYHLELLIEQLNLAKQILDQVTNLQPQQEAQEPIIEQNWNQIINQLIDNAQNPTIITDQFSPRTIALSPNGQLIAAGGDGEFYIKIWDINGNQVGNTLNGHLDCVQSIKFSKCGNFIISGSNDKTIRKWNVSNQQQIGLAMVGHEDWVSGVEYSRDETQIISSSNDNTIRFWNSLNGKEWVAKKIKHQSPILCSSVSLIKPEVVFGDESGTVTLWNYEARNSCCLKGHSKQVRSIQYSIDGKLIVSGSDDWKIYLWDAQLKQFIGTFNGHTSDVLSVNFSPDQKYIISGSRDQSVRIWDRIKRTQIGNSLTHHKDSVYQAQFFVCGKFIITACWDGEIWISSAP